METCYTIRTYDLATVHNETEGFPSLRLLRDGLDKHTNDQFLKNYFAEAYAQFGKRLERLTDPKPLTKSEEAELERLFRSLIEAKKLAEEE